ncbi:Retrovirus-related Pol polyprotein from transposon 17.6 [Labeo rohita]|uniref:ribonuclease H n=1 Tax=Labeo rohita TaxID=84645 RepID=A0ABQ8M3L8_LABRO|nr:Retrovirus-related Pol polyprotein from transposon 17.6 [Labeo rohita]
MIVSNQDTVLARVTPEPTVPTPPPYDGDPKACRPFLSQCAITFTLQPTTFATEAAKVAFVITLLTGKAREWGTTVREKQAPYCATFELEMIKVFDCSVAGEETASQLVRLRQGESSVTDFSIQFWTLAVLCGWNEAALWDECSALVDSRAEGNFVDATLRAQWGIPTTPLKKKLIARALSGTILTQSHSRHFPCKFNSSSDCAAGGPEVPLFSAVLPSDDVQSAATGYFLQDGMLLRKWVSHSEICRAVLEDSLKGKEPPISLLDYVNGFRRRLFLAGQAARENLEKIQEIMKRLFDYDSEMREFLRVISSKVAAVLTVSEGGGTAAGEEDGFEAPAECVLQPRLTNSQTLLNLGNLMSHLSSSQQQELTKVIHKFPALFGDAPSRTHLIEHDVDVGMSFGLRNAPATFQTLMNRVVSGLVGCAVYLDDIIDYSDTLEQHLERVCALFSHLAEAHLTVSLAKCEFAKATTVYLGREVGHGFPYRKKCALLNDSLFRLRKRN